jgi:hypothetical protein
MPGVAFGNGATLRPDCANVSVERAKKNMAIEVKLLILWRRSGILDTHLMRLRLKKIVRS